MDDTAAEDPVTMVKHCRLAGAKRALRLVKADVDRPACRRHESGERRRRGITHLYLSFDRLLSDHRIK